MQYLNLYLQRLADRGNNDLANAVRKTADDIVPAYISNFSFTEHVVSLLFGNVQSGKTSHMFGLICAAADAGFLNFILLTTDTILLQQQTLKRAQHDLYDFCVCDETDYIKFHQNNLRKPALIVLKKNSSVLKKWKSNLESTKFCTGNPLFIVDDEADASSLNTLINKKKQSTINRNIEAIKHTSSSSIYLQVTGTPQSLLLQTSKSGWKPYFIYYFDPGSNYLGGDFFFQDEKTDAIVLTDDTEAIDILSDDEFPENGLKTALLTHLVTSGHIFLNGGSVCNFLIHPSVKKNQHQRFAEKIGEYLNEISQSDDDELLESFKSVYVSLQTTKPDLCAFENIFAFIMEQIRTEQVRIRVLNSDAPYDENRQFHSGINIVIGGNTLGRGITFPQLQTIYYCRVSKHPQADTMWQHARMFGYDRDPRLMRVFIPPKLYKMFSDINKTNNSIVKQVATFKIGSEIKIVYPTTLNPTRKNVLDKNAVHIFSGGVNYFPFSPDNKNIETLDTLLQSFSDDVYTVSLRLIIKILAQVDSELNDWNSNTFIGFLNSFLASSPSSQGRLIVRRNRDIGKGTGTLLSPNDRVLGDSFPDETVLTVYKISGNAEKGWDGRKLWIPNIKLPGNCSYYTVEP